MPDPDEDPIVRDGRREAAISLTIFAIAISYTVGYCTLYGYERDFAEMEFIFGVPDWIFLGILIPWGLCTLAAWWMSAFFMSDNTLEAAAPPPDGLSDEEEGADD